MSIFRFIDDNIIIYFDIVNKLSMNNPVVNEVKPPKQQNAPIPMNANPQINLVANLQINQNPNPNPKTQIRLTQSVYLKNADPKAP